MSKQSYNEIKKVTVTVGDVRKSLPFGFTDTKNCALAQAAKRQIKNAFSVTYHHIDIGILSTNTVIIDEGYWTSDYEADKKYLNDNPTADPEEILHTFEVIQTY